MKLPSSVKNWISISGGIIAVFNLSVILSLIFLNTVFGFGGSYIGLFIYIILPVFLVGGLLMIPIGMRIYRNKTRKAEKEGKELNWPVIDFNNLATRNASLIFIAGTIFLLIISAVGSYEAFHYTESVEFCGKLCHKVMEPEYTTYHGSAHERVACVQCHVGDGAGWYVKSKLSGLYQVYSVIAKKYPTPIPTPIHNLRPARDICEKCHWPDKFFDNKLRAEHSFLADDQNTEEIVQLLIKTSTRNTTEGIVKGIHQHISPDVKIEYKTASGNKQEIPWVKYTNTKTGESYVYLDNQSSISKQQLDSLETRTMDCLDCHNRPSHNYNLPQNFIDKSILAGKIPRSLPGIKLVAMQALYQEYSTKDPAMMAIKNQVYEYYQSSYPDLVISRKSEIDASIAEIQNGYSNNIFPYMKASWKVYPNHIGHMESDGCFRCHNDRHATEAGKVISKDCNLCHEIRAQGNQLAMEYATTKQPLEFKHPVDIGDAWKTEMCSSCHSTLY